MQVLARAAIGVALLAGVAATQPVEVSAQEGGASKIAELCRELEPESGITAGECVSALVTLSNPGKADAVGYCKLILLILDIPHRGLGLCVRTLQGGGDGP